ncbi:hypothetical protein GCM10009863_66340 [Streptomyces axinellae]|uniref:Uncharacterized protein n=2 Tax=Streptomyces axinellae TaxID=552788 RepID=A0ABP6DF28_9ACTN
MWPPDAVEARPWNGDGPRPAYRFYPPLGPLLSIRVGGRWRPAVVRGREDREDGTVVYHVEITLTLHDGVRGTVDRAYVWDPAAMHPAPPVRGFGP